MTHANTHTECGLESIWPTWRRYFPFFLGRFRSFSSCSVGSLWGQNYLSSSSSAGQERSPQSTPATHPASQEHETWRDRWKQDRVSYYEHSEHNEHKEHNQRYMAVKRYRKMWTQLCFWRSMFDQAWLSMGCVCFHMFSHYRWGVALRIRFLATALERVVTTPWGTDWKTVRSHAAADILRWFAQRKKVCSTELYDVVVRVDWQEDGKELAGQRLHPGAVQQGVKVHAKHRVENYCIRAFSHNEKKHHN